MLRQLRASGMATAASWPSLAPTRVVLPARRQRGIKAPCDGASQSAAVLPPASSDADKRYTLGHVYGTTKPVVGVKQLDHNKRRRERVVAEIVEAGKRQGTKEEVIRANLDKMEALLPELTPDVNKMRAADWAKLAKDVNQVAMMLVIIKSAYPGANVGRIVGKAPKVLLQSPEQVAEDSKVVRRVLASAHNLDDIITEVPYLMQPAALAQSLNNVAKWYNTKDPVSIIAKNPKALLNVEEADLEADPLYGDAIYVEEDLPEIAARWKRQQAVKASGAAQGGLGAAAGVARSEASGPLPAAA